MKIKSIEERADGMVVYEVQDDNTKYVYNANKFMSLEKVTAEITKHKIQAAKRLKDKKDKIDKIKEKHNAGNKY